MKKRTRTRSRSTDQEICDTTGSTGSTGISGSARKKQHHQHPPPHQLSSDTPSNTPNEQQQQQQPAATIKITQQDHDRIVQLLRTIDWTMAKNTSRKNVIRENDPNTPNTNKGKSYCHSFIFGRNMKDPNCNYSWWSTTYPIIYQELQRFFSKYVPPTHFTYTHITLNKNLQCKRHTDGGNAGLSYIIAFGNYTGGQLQIDHGTTSKICNLYRTFVLFNGKEQPHETLPFTGERYTLVYYTSDIVPKEGITTGMADENHATIGSTTATDTTISNHRSGIQTLPPLVLAKDTGTITTDINNKESHTTTGSTSNGTTLTEKFHAMKKKLGRKR